MKRIRILYCITLELLLFIIFSCNYNDFIIKNQVLVVPKTFHGIVVIFYEQGKEIGEVEYKSGSHFFYVQDSIGVFFTRKKIAEATVTSLFPNSNISNYCSEMSINEYSDSTFKVVGGTYRGILTRSYKSGKDFLNFSVYKSGYVKDLKNGGWYVSDSIVENLYEKYK